MSDATIVEILLAVLTVAVTFGSYIGASRAARTQSTGTLSDIDAQAYHQAREIYESAIGTLGTHINQLKVQIASLDTEVTRLQDANRELRTQVTELQVANHRLETELEGMRSDDGHETGRYRSNRNQESS